MVEGDRLQLRVGGGVGTWKSPWWWVCKRTKQPRHRNLLSDPKTHRLPWAGDRHLSSRREMPEKIEAFKMALMTLDPEIAMTRLAAQSKPQEK